MIRSLSARRRAFYAGLALVAVVVAAVVAVATRSPSRTRAIGVPIVVVAGYGGSAGSVDGLVAALRQSGRTVTVVVGADSGRGPIAASAARLDAAIDDLATGEVDLVGYSAGGVIVRFWTSLQGRSARPRRIITVGSPHHGTALADSLTGLSPTDCVAACAELRPGSALLRGLAAGDETPTDAEWTSIWTADDETVVPPQTAVLAGARNIRLQDRCPALRVSHSGLVTDARVLRLIVSAVDFGAGEPGAGDPGASEPAPAANC
ncbi:MAG: lipase [Mycobacteriales bacterium]